MLKFQAVQILKIIKPDEQILNIKTPQGVFSYKGWQAGFDKLSAAKIQQERQLVIPAGDHIGRPVGIMQTTNTNNDNKAHP